MILRVRDLRKAFGGVHAVDGVSLELPRGEIRALIGPNGAGKTTVFNCATGTLRPDSGRIVFEGRRLDRARPYNIARAGLVHLHRALRARRDG